MPDNVERLGYDVSDFVSAVVKIKDGFTTQNNAVKEARGVLIEFNKDLKSLGGSATLILENGDKLVQNFKRVEGVLDLVSQKYKESTYSAKVFGQDVDELVKKNIISHERLDDAVKRSASIRKIEEEEEKRVIAARLSSGQRQEAEGALRKRFAPPDTASLAEFNTFQDRIASLLKLIESGKITLAQFNELLNNPLKGAAPKGLDEFETRARKILTLLKSDSDVIRRVQVPQAETTLRTAFPAPPSSSIEALYKYEDTVRKILTLISSGDVTLKKFNEIFKSQVLGESLGKLTADEAKARDLLLKLSSVASDDFIKKGREATDRTRAINKEEEAEIKRHLAELAKEDADKLKRLQDLVARANRIRADELAEEKRVIAARGEAYRNQKAFHENLQKEQAKQQAFLDQLNRTAALPGIESQLRAAFPTPTRATLTQLNEYQDRIQKILALLNSGKVTVAQFNDILAAQKAGISLGGLGPDQAKLRDLLLGFEEVGVKGSAAGNRILISWQGVVRLFETVIIRRFFHSFIDDITSSIRAADKYIETINRIAGATGQADVSSTLLGQHFRQIADANNVDALTLVQDAFLVLGARLGDVRGSTLLLNNALQLSRSTTLDFRRSLELVDETLRAYGLSTDFAGDVTKKLYALQTVGKVNLEQLASGYGRLVDVSNTLNISQNETNAALTQLTSAGLRTTDAVSALLAVFEALQHPSAQMLEVFRQWGTPTGQAAVATFTFAGVLQKLQQEIASGSGRLTDFAGRIGSIRGVTNLLTGDIQRNFSDTITALDQGADRADAAFERINSGAQRRLHQEFINIKNFFTTEFGVGIIAVLDNLNTRFGGFSEIIINIGRSVVSVVNTFVTLSSTLGILSAILKPLAENFQLILNILISYTTTLAAARAAIIAINTYLTIKTFLFGANTVAIGTNILAHLGLVSSQTAAAGSSAQLTQLLNYNTTALAVNTTAAAGASTALATLAPYIAGVAIGIGALAFIYSSTLQRQQDIARQAAQFFNRSITESAEEARRTEEDNRARSISNFRAFYDERLRIVNQFYAQLRRGITQQEDSLLETSRNISEQNREIVSNSLRDVNALLNESRRLLDESRKRAVGIQTRAEEREFQRSIFGLAPREEAERTFARTDVLRGRAISLFNQGELEESRRLFEEIDKLLQHIAERERANRDQARHLGVQFTSGAGGSEIDARLVANEQIRLELEQRLQTTQETRVNQALEGQNRLNALNREQARVQEQITFLVNQQSETAREASGLPTRIGANVEAAIGQLRTISNGLAFRGEQEALRHDPRPIFTPILAQLNDLINNLRRGLISVGDAQGVIGNITRNLSINRPGGLREELAPGLNISEAFQRAFETLQNIRPLQEREVELQQRLLLLEEERNRLAQATATFDAQGERLREPVGIRNLLESFGTEFATRIGAITAEQAAFIEAFGIEGARHAGALGGATPPEVSLNDRIRQSTDALITSFTTLQSRIDDIVRAIPPGPRANEGGFIARRFAEGGPVGQDTIPAWLTPGEFVMNAESTQRFFPQLIAMNQNRSTPVYNSNTETRTTTVGDINIHLAPTDSTQVNIRQIGEAIQREIRRGTLRLS